MNNHEADALANQLQIDIIKFNEFRQVFTPDGVDQGNAYYDQTTYGFLVEPTQSFPRLDKMVKRFFKARAKLGKHLAVACQHPEFKEACLHSMRLLLPTALESAFVPLVAGLSLDEMVVFEISPGLDLQMSSLRHFLHIARISAKPTEHRSWSLLCVPYWVYLVFAHVLTGTLRPDCRTAKYAYLSDPYREPAPEVLASAIVLWDSTLNGPYTDFAAALAAAELLA